MAATNTATEQALSLATSLGAGSQDMDQAVSALTGAAGADDLGQARAELVARIFSRSDDFQATAALQLVNKALAEIGWRDPFSWKHRKKP